MFLKENMQHNVGYKKNHIKELQILLKWFTSDICWYNVIVKMKVPHRSNFMEIKHEKRMFGDKIVSLLAFTTLLQFIYLFIYCFKIFIVIQLQLSAFSPHPSTPPQPSPPPSPHLQHFQLNKLFCLCEFSPQHWQFTKNILITIIINFLLSCTQSLVVYQLSCLM